MDHKQSATLQPSQSTTLHSLGHHINSDGPNSSDHNYNNNNNNNHYNNDTQNYNQTQQHSSQFAIDQTPTLPTPFSRRFTGHRELLNHLYCRQEVDIHIIRDAIATNNVDLIIETTAFLLDRFAQSNMNVEKHFSDSITPGHRAGEAATFNYLGINKGQRSVDAECQYLFELFHGYYSAQMVDLFRLIRSRHYNNGTEFKNAVYGSPLRHYQAELENNLISIPPSRHDYYLLAYAIELTFTGPDSDSLVKLLVLDKPLDQLAQVFTETTHFSPLLHYTNITMLLEFIIGLVFCTGRYQLFDALFGQLIHINNNNNNNATTNSNNNTHNISDDPNIISLKQYHNYYPTKTNPENCSIPWIIRKTLLSNGLTAAYGSYHGHLEMKQRYEFELHHPTAQHSLAPEKITLLQQMIFSCNHEADMRFDLFHSLLSTFGVNFWSTEDIRTVHLLAMAYNDTETLDILERMFHISSLNMSTYSYAIRKSLITSHNYLIDLYEFIGDSPSPDVFLYNLIPNMIRRGLITALKFILRSQNNGNNTNINSKALLPTLVMSQASMDAIMNGNTIITNTTTSIKSNLLAYVANGQLATINMIEFLLQNNIQPILNSSHPHGEGQISNFLYQIFSSPLPQQQCLELVTIVVQYYYSTLYDVNINGNENINAYIRYQNNNDQTQVTPDIYPNHTHIPSITTKSNMSYTPQQYQSLTRPQLTLNEFLQLFKSLFGSLQPWRQHLPNEIITLALPPSINSTSYINGDHEQTDESQPPPNGGLNTLLLQFIIDNHFIEPNQWSDLYSNPYEYVTTIISIVSSVLKCNNDPNNGDNANDDGNVLPKFDATSLTPNQLHQYYTSLSTIFKLLIPKEYSQQLYRLSIPERQDLSYIIFQFLIIIGHCELIQYCLDLLDIPLTPRHFTDLVIFSTTPMDYRNLLLFFNYPFTNLSDFNNLKYLFQQNFKLSTVGFPDYIDFLTLIDQVDYCPTEYLQLTPQFINQDYNLSCPTMELKELVFGKQFRDIKDSANNDNGIVDVNNNNDKNITKTSTTNNRNSNLSTRSSKDSTIGTNNKSNNTIKSNNEAILNRFIEFDMGDFSKSQLSLLSNNQNDLTNSLYTYVLRGGKSIPNNECTLTFEDSSIRAVNDGANNDKSNLDHEMNNNNNTNNNIKNGNKNNPKTTSTTTPSQTSSTSLPSALTLEYINSNTFQSALEWLYQCFDHNDQLASADRSPFLTIFEIFYNFYFLSEQQRNREKYELKQKNQLKKSQNQIARDSLQDPFASTTNDDTNSIHSVTTNTTQNSTNTVSTTQKDDNYDPNEITPQSLLSFFQLLCTAEMESTLISHPHGILLPILFQFFPSHTFYNTAFLSSYSLNMVSPSLLSTVWTEDYIFQGLITLAMVTDKAKLSHSLYTGFRSFQQTQQPFMDEYLSSRQQCLLAQEQLSKHIALDEYEYQYGLYYQQWQLLIQQQQQQEQQSDQNADNNTYPATTTGSYVSSVNSNGEGSNTLGSCERDKIPLEFNPIDFDLTPPTFTRESLYPVDQLHTMIDYYNETVLPMLLPTTVWNMQQFCKVYYPFKFTKRASNMIVLQCLTAILASAQSYLPMLSKIEKDWVQQCDLITENYRIDYYHYKHQQRELRRQERFEQRQEQKKQQLDRINHDDNIDDYEEDYDFDDEEDDDDDRTLLDNIDLLSLLPPKPSILLPDNLLPNFKPFIYFLRHLLSHQPIPNLLLKSFYITFRPYGVYNMVNILDIYLTSGGKLVGQPNNRHLSHFDQISFHEQQCIEAFSPYPAQYYLLSDCIATNPMNYAYYYFLTLKIGYKMNDYSHEIGRVIAERERKMVDFIIAVYDDDQKQRQHDGNIGGDRCDYDNNDQQYQQVWVPIIKAVSAVVGASVVLGSAIGLYSWFSTGGSTPTHDDNKNNNDNIKSIVNK